MTTGVLAERYGFHLCGVAALLILLLMPGCGVATAPHSRVTFETALGDLTNTAAFSMAPRGAMRMVSTYDRAGGNSDWARTQPLTSRGTVVLADMAGPACLRRMWLTGIPDEHELSFYFDGESTPRLKIPVRDLYGQRPPFLVPLAQRLSGGHYSYVPLPFRKALRVELTVPSTWKNPTPFFQANYEVFPKGVDVETFDPDRASHSDAIRNILNAWSAVSAAADAKPPVADTSVEIPPSAGAVLMETNGPGMIEEFVFRLDRRGAPPAGRKVEMSREAVLRITWDDAASPSVEAPVGDFFCNAFYSRRFSSLAMASQNGTLTCRLPMPFAKRALFEVRNDGPDTLLASSSFRVRRLSEGEMARQRYLHATWNQGVGMGRPYAVFGANGPGHFIGCYLVAVGMDGSWNILEGDESIQLDGAVEPAFRGTGLEDYFNGGWYYYGLFSMPLHGLVDKAPIRTSQFRFHLVDPIRFDRRIAMQWEFGHGDAAKGYMSSVAYWYADKPCVLETGMPAVSRRTPPRDPLERYAVLGALIELERMGRYDEAMDFCRLYAERYAGAPEADVIRLRLLGYRAAVEGFAAVRREYESFAARTNEQHLAVQARSIMDAATGKSALIGANGNGPFVLYLDGRPCLSGDQPLRLYSTTLALVPGEHEFSAEVVAPARPGPYWFLMGMRSTATNMATDASWEVTEVRPSSWPATGDSAAWRPARQTGLPPFMSYWAFEPNAFIDMQSGQRYIDNGGGDWPAGKSVYFRKRFSVPAAPRGPAAGDARES